jgi:uncharacterized Rmd1/YagE family protein
MEDTKKRKANKPAKSVAKTVNINDVKKYLLEEIKVIKKEKEEKDPENILLNLAEEIQQMIDAKLSITEQHTLLKKYGVIVKLAFYKDHITKMGYTNLP